MPSPLLIGLCVPYHYISDLHVGQIFNKSNQLLDIKEIDIPEPANHEKNSSAEQ